MKKIYAAHLLEHYHNSPYRGELLNPHLRTAISHPSCGDQIVLTAYLEGSTINQIAFSGSGCILSQAATSLLAQHLQSKSISDAENLTFNDMQQLVGVEVGILRSKCIMLALEALQEAIKAKK